MPACDGWQKLTTGMCYPFKKPCVRLNIDLHGLTDVYKQVSKNQPKKYDELGFENLLRRNPDRSVGGNSTWYYGQEKLDNDRADPHIVQ